jgi:hypothetical protein
VSVADGTGAKYLWNTSLEHYHYTNHPIKHKNRFKLMDRQTYGWMDG